MGRNDFVGKYLCTETVGLEEFYEEMGFTWIVRKGMSLFSDFKPSLEVLLEGETMFWHIDNLHPTHEFMRECTAESTDFEHVDQFGNAHRCKVYWEHDDFVILMTPVKEDAKGYKVLRQLTETGVTQTIFPMTLTEVDEWGATIPAPNLEKATVRKFIRKSLL